MVTTQPLHRETWLHTEREAAGGSADARSRPGAERKSGKEALAVSRRPGKWGHASPWGPGRGRAPAWPCPLGSHRSHVSAGRCCRGCAQDKTAPPGRSANPLGEAGLRPPRGCVCDPEDSRAGRRRRRREFTGSRAGSTAPTCSADAPRTTLACGGLRAGEMSVARTSGGGAVLDITPFFPPHKAPLSTLRTFTGNGSCLGVVVHSPEPSTEGDGRSGQPESGLAI